MRLPQQSAVWDILPGWYMRVFRVKTRSLHANEHGLSTFISTIFAWANDKRRRRTERKKSLKILVFIVINFFIVGFLCARRYTSDAVRLWRSWLQCSGRWRTFLLSAWLMHGRWLLAQLSAWPFDIFPEKYPKLDWLRYFCDCFSLGLLFDISAESFILR